MSVTGRAGSRLSTALEPLAPVAVPIGLAVLTWLTLLLTAGLLARLGSVSLLNLLPLFFVGVLFWPIYEVAPWREGVTARTRRWASRRGPVFVVTGVLAVVPLVPFVPDLLVTLLQLPYRGTGIFFGASLFYRARFGPLVGRLVLGFGQTYLQLFWLYLLATGVVALVGRFR